MELVDIHTIPFAKKGNRSSCFDLLESIEDFVYQITSKMKLKLCMLAKKHW